MIKLWASRGGVPFHKEEIKFTSFKFSGGEIQVRLPPQTFLPDRLEILAKIYNSDDIMELFLVTDAIRGIYNKTPIHVTIPYFPYARQDRRCAPGEAFSVNVFNNLLETMQYDKVIVWDPHSDYFFRNVNEGEIWPAYEFVSKIPKDLYTHLVMPDKGSEQRVNQCALLLEKPVVRCEKIRDPNNGNLSGVKIHAPDGIYGGVLIVDDICDGGRTFINLAKELRKITSGKIYLYVTHGIFSQGLVPLKYAGIDNVYCPNIWPKWKELIEEHTGWLSGYLTEIKL